MSLVIRYDLCCAFLIDSPFSDVEWIWKFIQSSSIADGWSLLARHVALDGVQWLVLPDGASNGWFDFYAQLVKRTAQTRFWT